MKDQVVCGPGSRRMRLVLIASEYRFDVVHKPGVTHGDADGGRRAYLDFLIITCDNKLTRLNRATMHEASHSTQEGKREKQT
eukprot:scaffold73939_cov26-Tisochrysis_lutea.AAC.1